MFGYPKVVESENGSPFQGKTWKQYLRNCGIQHQKIPYLEQANAQVENLNKPLMKAIRLPLPKDATGNKKCTRVFKPTYELHTIADTSKTKNKTNATMKKHACQRTRTSELHVSDELPVKQPKLIKFNSRDNPRRMVITDWKGSMVTACPPSRPINKQKLLTLPTHNRHYPERRHVAAATRTWLPRSYLNWLPIFQNPEVTVEPGYDLTALEQPPTQTRPKRTIVKSKRLIR